MTDPRSQEISVIVVDDQPLVRMGNSLVLDTAEDIHVVGEAASGEQAIALTALLAPDVVLMDVRMPGMGGLEATRHITRTQPDTRVIVLTTFDLDEYAFGALKAGASAFLLKSTTPTALTEAVRIVAAGDAVVEPRITRQLIDAYSGQRYSEPGQHPGQPSQLSDLTPREFDIFLAIGSGLSNPEITNELNLSSATVKTHINRIFSKLQLRDRVQAVILAYELGLVGRDPIG
ncbi:response regulator transcription factor [Glaciihabitans sp. UYNi722]|uniref:response regulator transcription factor n=1 Tax=Glaciihabitans sp. UYNi722 TaxID=3156344 RepID=UPI0033983FBF